MSPKQEEESDEDSEESEAMIEESSDRLMQEMYVTRLDTKVQIENFYYQAYENLEKLINIR